MKNTCQNIPDTDSIKNPVLRNFVMFYAVAVLILLLCTSLSASVIDTDGDGIPDSSDNCMFVANPDQNDTEASSPVTGLIGYWKLDESSGDVARDSTGTHDGIVSGASWVSGKFRNALSFDGADDSVTIADSEAFDFTGQDYSIETWIKPSTPQNAWAVLFSRGYYMINGWYIQLDAAGTGVYFITNVPGGFSSLWSNPGVVQPGVWNHLVVTRQGPVGTIYVNGVDVTLNHPIIINAASSTYPFLIGTYPLGGYNYNGAMDSIRIYDHALSSAEVQTAYAAGDGQGDACDCNDGVCDGREASYCAGLGTPDPECAVQTDNDQDGYAVPADCDDNDALVHPGAAEVCDGKDNNCDGVVDAITRSCSLNHTGICGTGTETCNAGVWEGCPQPQAEICNGLDDDCNGAIDEVKQLVFVFNKWQNWGKKGDIDSHGIAPYVYADNLPGSPYASGEYIPINAQYATENKDVPGLALDSGNGFFDVWLWGKNDGIQKEAVNVTLYLDGIAVKSIQNIQGNPYEKSRDGKAVFGNAGQDQVWVQAGNRISFVSTVTNRNDAFRVYYQKTTCSNNDEDGDTIPDYLDVCPNSISDAGINLNPDRYADINGNGVFETKEKKGKKEIVEASNYTLQNTLGCTCRDILSIKPGKDEDQYKKGCTKGTIVNWIDARGWGKAKP